MIVKTLSQIEYCRAIFQVTTLCGITQLDARLLVSFAAKLFSNHVINIEKKIYFYCLFILLIINHIHFYFFLAFFMLHEVSIAKEFNLKNSKVLYKPIYHL